MASERPPRRSSLALALALLTLAGCPSSGSGVAPDGAATGGSNASGGQPGAGSGGGPSASGGASTATGGSGAGGGGAVSEGGRGGSSGGRTGSGGGSGGVGGGPGSGGAGRAGNGGGAGSQGGPGGSSGDGGAPVCPGRRYDAAVPPQVLTLSGNLGAHDPAALVVGNTIYLAATGLIGKTSTNLTTWSSAPAPLALPEWARTATGATNLWAPDLSFFGGMYHLYYSASTFGSNRSCIGHATRASLASGSWADQGMMLCSSTTDNWNAIDPNIVIDDAGTPWMAFGSFWSGLKLVKLTSAGVRADTTLHSIANGANGRGSLEGAWIFKACGYYYLFSSWGACCDGAFDYNMRVGRATTITGPYVDKAGTSLMAGGGTLLVQGNASWGAPGHQSVIVHNDKVYNLYHALQGGRGTATLRIAEIVWDDGGWPVTAGP